MADEPPPRQPPELSARLDASAFRWAWAEASQHRKRFWVTMLLPGLIVGGLTSLKAPWPLAVIAGLVGTVLFTFVFALLQALKQQRDGLRIRVRALEGSASNLVKEIEWVRAQRIPHSEGTRVPLDEVCSVLGNRLATWTRDFVIAGMLGKAFPYPETLPMSKGFLMTGKFAQSAMATLVGEGLAEEERRLQSETRSGPAGIVFSRDPSKESHTVDTSFSEYRWTQRGRETMKRLAEGR